MANVPTKKATVVLGEKGTVPIYLDTHQSNYGRLANGTVVRVIDESKIPPSELSKYYKSPFIQIWNEDGTLIKGDNGKPPDDGETWIKKSHLAIIDEDQPPEPEGEEDLLVVTSIEFTDLGIVYTPPSGIKIKVKK